MGLGTSAGYGIRQFGDGHPVLVRICVDPRWVMEAFGLPYKEYFIWFDDAEYTLRITKSCPGVEVLDSVVLHDMGVNQGVNYSMVNEKNVWKFSYGARNEDPIVTITGARETI